MRPAVESDVVSCERVHAFLDEITRVYRGEQPDEFTRAVQAVQTSLDTQGIISRQDLAAQLKGLLVARGVVTEGWVSALRAVWTAFCEEAA